MLQDLLWACMARLCATPAFRLASSFAQFQSKGWQRWQSGVASCSRAHDLLLEGFECDVPSLQHVVCMRVDWVYKRACVACACPCTCVVACRHVSVRGPLGCGDFL
jgi:hypothetical protein